MKFVLVEPDGKEQTLYLKTPNDKTLGDMFAQCPVDIKAIQINDEFDDNWMEYRLCKRDKITLYVDVAAPAIPFIINLVLSIAFSALASLLAPKPKKPKSSKSQPSLGVAGVQNTIAPGTPKFGVYGTRRVYGHLIASWIDMDEAEQVQRTDSSRKMKFSALYFMGVGKVASMSEVKINNTHLCDIYGPPRANYRLGTSDQTIIPNHELVHQTYSDGRELEITLRRSKSLRALPGRPITYTTKGQNVNRVTFFFNFPAGLWALGMNQGATYRNFVDVRILRKKNSETSWTDIGLFRSIRTKTKSGFFWKLPIDLPEAGYYDFQLNVERQQGHGSWESGPSMVLYNVMETKFIETAYPGNALLEVNGIANDQINSFENMECSAIMQGRLVDVLVNGVYVKQFSRNRVWITRDILFDTEFGLGNRLDSRMWDDNAGLAAANYYEESVAGYSGNEQRDYCDVIINDTGPGWDYVKTLLFEGQAIIFLSGGKFKYTLNKDRTPEMLYSSPGNIIAKSLQVEKGSQEKPVNTLRSEFPNHELDYKVIPLKLISDDRGSDPERLETISITSITRKSQVARLMNFRLRSLTDIKRRWTWKAPQTAVVSEPLDVAWLAYNTPKNLRGYNGFVKGSDHTTSQFITDRSVYLASGYTYTTHVRHLGTVEERIISNTTGATYSIFNVTSPFSFTPDNGDIWVIGKQNEQVEKIQIDDVEFKDGSFLIRAHEHLSTIYDNLLGDVTTTENTTGTTTSVIPLLDAQARYFSSGGSTQGYIFNVVPGFSSLVGTYSNLSGTTLTLGDLEISRDDYFVNAYITADVDPPAKITDYDGTTKVATVNTSFLLAATLSGEYSIGWPLASTFDGFQVEGLSGLTWNVLTSVVGTSTTLLTGSTYSSFRFTPLDANSVGNTLSQVIVSEGMFDVTAPDTPLSLFIATDETLDGISEFSLKLPLDRDVQYVEVEFVSGLTNGDISLSDQLDVSKYRDELNNTGILTLHLDVELDTYAPGTTFSARASALDFFGNRSSWVNSFSTITLSNNENTEPADSGTIDTEGGATGALTGGSIFTLFSDTIAGGVIGGDNQLRLDLNLLVTPGSTVTTSVNFYYTYAGLTVSTIPAYLSDNSTAIANDTPYWLSFLISPINESFASQFTTAKKTGAEVPTNDTRSDTQTIESDSTVDQDLSIYAQITGDTSTTIEVINATLTQLFDSTTATTREPYIVAGAVPGQPTASSYVLIHPFSIPASFAAGLTDSWAYTRMPVGGTTSLSIFSLQKNDVEFGTMEFAPAENYATFSSSAVSFVEGDVLTIQTPSSGGTVSVLGWSILGTKD